MEGTSDFCGTYVKQEYRKGIVAQQILSYVLHTLRKENILYLGVDCETINPTALRFWKKYFQNYTYSFHRRLDERIIGYDQYYHEYCNKQN